jgi:transglutaminase-like putative cysteine protease
VGPSVEEYLRPGRFVDSDSPAVEAFALDAVGASTDPVERAARLFAAVRDRIWYDPYDISDDPEDYRASAVARSRTSWCVPKAVLLAAGARALGIPARLGFADVRNHLQTPRLRERMGGTEVFIYHGYAEMYLDGSWVKATPAFNAELCARFGVEPIAFDGRTDALLHQFSADGSRYMEYGTDRGVFADLPLEEILGAFRATYGPAMIGRRGAQVPVDAFSAPQAAS